MANFDRIARLYRWMEYATFGPLLERCRFAQLDSLADPRHALVLGDGDGRFVARLLERYPNVTADVIDLSPAMMSLTRQRVEKHGARANLHVEDVRSFSLPKKHSYDLVTAHFFLDCLSEPEVDGLLQSLRPRLTLDAVFLISEFAFPARGALRLLGRMLVGTLYLAFHLLTGLETRSLPDYSAALSKAGFDYTGLTLFLGGILRSERWSLSHSRLSD